MSRFAFFCMFLFYSSWYFSQLNRNLQPNVLAQSMHPNQSEKFSVAKFNMVDQTNSFVQFQKLELGVSLPKSIENRIVSFFTIQKNLDPINPFRYEDIAIYALFTDAKGNRLVRDAFYYKEFTRNLTQNKWLEDTTSYPFRIRFSPPLAIDYKATVFLKVKSELIDSVSFQFHVIESDNQGFLEKGEHGKHLRFSKNKTSFIGVGQDIPWPVWEDWSRLDKAIGPRNVQAMYRSMENLQEANGNFTRFVAATWFMQLEYEALGNYAPRLGQAWEFDRMVEFCEDNQLYFMYCALLHTPLQSRTEQDAGQTPGVRWENYCYNDAYKSPAGLAHEPAIGIKQAIEYYSHPKALEHTKNYFRYLEARYAYSTAFAAWQLMSEVDETAEYRDIELNGQMVDRSENRLHVRNWTNSLSIFLKEKLSDVHPVSIAIIKGKGYSKTLWDPELYNLKYIDFYGYHDYMYENETGEGKARNRNSLLRFNSINELGTGYQNGKITYPSFQNKMFIYDEFGHFLSIAKPPNKDSGIDPTTEFNNCADFMFKQDLWFTFAAGCAVAGLDWWNNDQLPRFAMWKKYFGGFLEFTKDLDFENVDYTKPHLVEGRSSIAQRWPTSDDKVTRSNSSPYRNKDRVEAYTQVASNKNQAFGWLANRTVNWYNLKEEYPCLKSLVEGTMPYSIPYLYKPKDDDLPEKACDIPAQKAFFKVKGFKSIRRYEICYYNTLTGLPMHTLSKWSGLTGKIKCHVPEMKVSDNPDLAYKIKRKGFEWK